MFLVMTTANKGFAPPPPPSQPITNDNWVSMASSTNGVIYAIADVVSIASENICFVAGEFTEAGGVPANNIAKFNVNTSTWSALGGGTNATVRELKYNSLTGILYVGGSFTSVNGDIDAGCIAQFDTNTSTWNRIGTAGMAGAYPSVNAITFEGATLYAAGFFDTADGTEVNNVAKWNGVAWSALGTGTNDEVNALIIEGTGLYAGGYFTTAGTVTNVGYIAKWTPASGTWSALGLGLDGFVNTFALGNLSTLWVGGFFTTAGGEPANSIAVWPIGGGGSWSTLGSGMNYEEVNKLKFDGKVTYAGGKFTYADSVLTNNIARWDPYASSPAWEVLGSGTDDTVRAIGLDYNTQSGAPVLYVGGDFTTAGGKPSMYLAKCATDDTSLPGAPTNVTAVPGNTKADVSFIAPVDDGGGDIISYTVTSKPEGVTATGDGSTPITVNGLTNGKSYAFTVTATNAIGTGPSSAASKPVTPATVPAAPAIGEAKAGTGQATVAFTAPVNNGGSKIILYTATSSPSGITATSKTSPITVTGLTASTPYQFKVTAKNSIGTSLDSEYSNIVTVNTSSVPGSPTIGTVIRGNKEATVSFLPPKNNGGSAITYYTAKSNAGHTVTGAAIGVSAKPITVTGLDNGKPYTFKVTATNVKGEGPASKSSKAVIPATVPDKPTVKATGGIGKATIAVSGFNGGNAIKSYTATHTPTGITVTSKTSPITVTGLTGGTAYVFTVTAKNALGSSDPSETDPVTPSGLPGVPGIGANPVRGNTQATVTFTKPASDGGATITMYTATAYKAGVASKTGTFPATSLTTSGSITVKALTNGTAYTFRVTAKNTVGTGPASAESNSVTPAAAPGKPTIGQATAAAVGQINVKFKAPTSNGGSAIILYTATSSPGGKQGTTTPGGIDAGITVSGLISGTDYSFKVKAKNGVGTGVESEASNIVLTE